MPSHLLHNCVRMTAAARFGGLFLVAAAIVIGTPSIALAAGDGSTAGRETGIIVGFILMISMAFLAAHFIVDGLQRRFLVISGIEYIVLGVLLGLLTKWQGLLNDIGIFLPVIALAAGWVGLLRGTDFNIAAAVRITEPGTARIVFLHHFIPGVLVGVVAYYALTLTDYFSGITDQAAIISAAFLGCCAAADSSEPFQILSRRYEVSGKLAPLLKRATKMGDILIVIVFGLIFCFFHGADSNVDFSVTAPGWAWTVWTFVLGGGLGIVFTYLLGGNDSDNSRFLALVGTISFASGAAFFLELSPLAVNLILGIFLVNLSREGHLVHATLESTEKPMALVLMVFAGVIWPPTNWGIAFAGLVFFVVVRLLGKVIGSLLTGWGTSLRNDLFRGLLAHGEVTAAMAVSFRLVYDGPAADVAYSIVLGSIIFHDLIAPRVLRGLLVDEGEIQGELRDSNVEALAGAN